MKSLLLVFMLALSLAQARAEYLVTISGTATSEKELRGSRTGLHATPLSAGRIYKEFGVSPDDYALVFDTNLHASLALRPRRTNSALPVIFVFQAFEPEPRSRLDTSNRFAFEAPISQGAAPTPMFKDFLGTTFGRGHVTRVGKVRAEYDVLGSSSEYFLKFKITLQEIFVPKP
jgi:hypothetical protein